MLLEYRAQWRQSALPAALSHHYVHKMWGFKRWFVVCTMLLHSPDNDSQLWQHNTRCSVLTPSVLELFRYVTGLRCYNYIRQEVQCRRKMTIYVCVTCTRASPWGFLDRRRDVTLSIGTIMDLPGCIAAARRGKALFSGRFQLARSCLRPTSCLPPPSALRKPVVARALPGVLVNDGIHVEHRSSRRATERAQPDSPFGRSAPGFPARHVFTPVTRIHSDIWPF